MKLLTDIEIIFPQNSGNFFKNFKTFFSDLCSFIDDEILLPNSQQNSIPKIHVKEQNINVPLITFISGDKILKNVELTNKTGKNIESPHKYKSIDIETVSHRIGLGSLESIDHAGMNLPWFEEDLHPEIKEIRNILKDKCLYHLFPTGENWDFIIPATQEELKENKIDYSEIRKPKFEIVSFEKASTPLVQFDISLKLRYEKIEKLFPEGIAVPEIRNIWVYLKNPYGIDICLVLNENSQKDWAEFFKDTRFV